MESVAEIVKSFKSINPDGKSEQEYQARLGTSRILLYVETIREVIRHFKARVRGHASRKNLDHRIKYVAPERLGQNILPALKRRLWLFSLALNTSNSPKDTKPWYSGILDHLADIDDLLEDTDTYIISIWRSYTPNQGYPVFVDDIPFRVQRIAEHVRELFESQLGRLFDAYHTFFDDFRLLKPCSNALSSPEEGNTVYRLTAASSEKIDDILGSLDKSSLGLAKEGWQKLVKEIDTSFEYPLEGPVLNPLDPDYPNGYEELILGIETRRNKSFQAATPVVKLCRIYFKKLVRPTNNQPLIFVAPSMNMTEDQLMRFVEHTNRTDSFTDHFVSVIIHWSDQLDVVFGVTVELQLHFRELSPILEEYWESLLESNNPRVDQQAIADTRQWLESWKSHFPLAMENFIQITGCNDFPRPIIDERHTGVEEVSDESDTEQSDQENGSVFKYGSDGEDRLDGKAGSDGDGGLDGEEDPHDEDNTE
ncbi:hypothetical protein PGT21_017292 [Puccinia graminis f. sp. tritici]|uniref:Uncharacterized protein n=1 Tax=Puccinia graminis f. sp. tritici TaxID=56615 RepID=A0A5B0QFJ4_PUCGR|nr:hypothetical protein PGT21_017292 [Puccinia graminis f. sp. tritici]